MKDLWTRLKAKYERKGVNIAVTRGALALGAAHATTGIFAKTWTETAIDMIIVNERENTVLTPAGEVCVIEATGYTDTRVVVGDTVKLAPKLTTEKMTNGGFESDFTGWTQTGTPDIETTNIHGGTKSCKLTAAEAVDQTLTTPASTTAMLELLTRYRVMAVTPHKIGTVITHYQAKLMRLHEPVNFGSVTFWWSISVPTDYGTGNGKWKVTVTYTDDTTTIINYDETEAFDPSGFSGWTQEDITSLLDGTKDIANIKFERVASSSAIYIDDVSILV